MSIKQIVKYGSFTDDDLEITKSLLNAKAHPEFYIPHDGTPNTLPKGIEYVETTLVSSSTINRTGAGSRQPIRKSGKNPKINELAHSISVGYNLGLTEKPICVIYVNGQLIELNGRTRFKILLDNYKHKNVIVNLYKFVGEYVNSPILQDDAIENFGLLANTPIVAGQNLTEDWIEIGKKRIDRGTLEADYDAIESWLSNNARSFTKQKITTMASTIYQQRGNINAGLQLIAWSKDDGENWLKLNGYNNTKDILYVIVSSAFASKAIFKAAEIAQQNPGKEIRVILHTGRLEGKDVGKAYVDSVLDFKTQWYANLAQLSFGYFNGKTPTDSPIKLFGVLPANVFNLCEDDGKLIIFGVNDKPIDDYEKNRDAANLEIFFDELGN